MSATERVEVTTTAPAEPAAESKPPEEKQVTRVKKPRARKPKGSKSSAPSHPPYFQMIKDAILALNEKTGSSPHAIAKHMEERHKGVLPPNYKKVLAVQLRNFAAKGKLVKVKASFKLVETGKVVVVTKKPKGSARVAAAKKKKKTRSVASVKSPKVAAGAKKLRKAAPAKPKQPKSIKSPAAKKVKKSAA